MDLPPVQFKPAPCVNCHGINDNLGDELCATCRRLLLEAWHAEDRCMLSYTPQNVAARRAAYSAFREVAR